MFEKHSLNTSLTEARAQFNLFIGGQLWLGVKLIAGSIRTQNKSLSADDCLYLTLLYFKK